MIVFYAALGALVAGIATGWTVHSWKTDAERKAEIDGYIVAVRQGIERDRKGNAVLSADLAASREARAADEREFNRRLREARRGNKLVSVDCPRPVAGGTPTVAGDVPRVRLTADAIRLWNDAIGAPAVSGAGRTDDTGGKPGATRGR